MRGHPVGTQEKGLCNAASLLCSDRHLLATLILLRLVVHRSLYLCIPVWLWLSVSLA